MGTTKLQKIVSSESKLYNQMSELSLNKHNNTLTKKSYLVPHIQELIVSTITAAGSNPSDFDAFNTSSS